MCSTTGILVLLIACIFDETEENRLSYLLFIQKKLRADLYQGAADALRNGDNDGANRGKRIVLLTTHPGPPRAKLSSCLRSFAAWLLENLDVLLVELPSLSPFLSASVAP